VGDLRTAAREALEPLRRQARRDAAAFLAADEAAQHRSRKRLKRLRYACEFMAPLFPERPQRKPMAALRRCLDELGAYNDLLVATALFRSAVAQDPQAWFAVGWLQARREWLLARCERSLASMAKAAPFWRA